MACMDRQAVEAGELLQAVAVRLAGRTWEQLIAHLPLGRAIHAPMQSSDAGQIASQPIELQARERCRDRVGRMLLERCPQLPVLGVREGRSARVLLVPQKPEGPQAPAPENRNIEGCASRPRCTRSRRISAASAADQSRA